MKATVEPPPAATAVAAVAEHVRVAGAEPWLFYRERWHWAWRSWRRVADQVARGQASVERFAVAEGRSADRPVRVAFDARQDPDAIATGLAIQSAGAVAVPWTGDRSAASAASCDGWAEVEGSLSHDPPPGGLERIVVPAALTQLDRTERCPLETPAGPTTDGVAFSGSRQVSGRELMAAARQLDARVPVTAKRPVACAAPDLAVSVSQLVQTWTLARGAAWVLEPHPEAFVATVLWARPSIVFTTAAGLRQLASSFEHRRHRRHSRVEAAIVVGGETVDESPWHAAGVRIVVLGEDPLDALRSEVAAS